MKKLLQHEVAIYGLAEEHNEGCDGGDTESMIEVFWALIRKLDLLPVSKAECDLQNFKLALDCSVEYFNLTLEKITTAEEKQWVGTFTFKDKYLKLFSIPVKHKRVI